MQLNLEVIAKVKLFLLLDWFKITQDLFPYQLFSYKPACPFRTQPRMKMGVRFKEIRLYSPQRSQRTKELAFFIQSKKYRLDKKIDP